MSTTRVNLDVTQYVRVTSDPLQPSSLLLQSHRDTVRIAVSDVKPARDNTVFHELGEKDGIQNVPLTETAVWALATTDHCALTATEQRSVVTVDDGFMYADVRSISRVDVNIATADMWSGSTEREDVPINDEAFQVIRTGSRWLIIEDINVDLDFSNAGTGRYIYELVAYVQGSNGGAFSYDQDSGTVTPLGRNLNTRDINVFPEGVVETNPTNSAFSGDPDFRLLFIEYFLEVQGNRESVSENGSDFFEGDRRLLLPPNSEVLLLATTTGNASGTADIRSTFFISESEELGI